MGFFAPSLLTSEKAAGGVVGRWDAADRFETLVDDQGCVGRVRVGLTCL
jgi:hypothetical protein